MFFEWLAQYTESAAICPSSCPSNFYQCYNIHSCLFTIKEFLIRLEYCSLIHLCFYRVIFHEFIDCFWLIVLLHLVLWFDYHFYFLFGNFVYGLDNYENPTQVPFKEGVPLCIQTCKQCHSPDTIINIFNYTSNSFAELFCNSVNTRYLLSLL